MPLSTLASGAASGARRALRRRAGPALACLLAAAAAGTGAPAGNPAWAQAAEARIAAVSVQGARRIDPQTVTAHLLVGPGDPFDAELLDRSLKALFATGLFADAALRREGDTLVVEIVENPVINRIAFEGNKRVDTETLERETQLRPRLVFTRTRVQRDVKRILDIYRASGRFATRVEPKIVRLEQNRVDLVFEIEEGPLSRIRAVSFIGNRRFSDSALRSVIQTREYAFWRLLSTTDTYDPDRLGYDRELLRRFYLENGYADFKVVSAVAELTPDREGFVVTFTLDEGERYRFGGIGLDIRLRRVEPAALEPLIATAEGEWYDAGAVDDTVDAMTDALGDLGYAFVDIRPQVARRRDDRAIDLVYLVGEGNRIFVERIDIEGNVRTLDEVIRREFELTEGDAFNVSKLRRSRRAIGNLGFFRSVEVANREGSTPDRTTIQATVDEQSTGEISFGVGFSSLDGVLGDIGIRERNLLGRGQDLSAGVQGSARRQEFNVAFTEPYFLDRDLSAGFDVFRTTRDRQRDSSFDERKTGGGVRFGYALGPDLRHGVRYQLRRTEIRDVDERASRFVRDQEGATTVSQIGQTLTLDRRDSRVDPREGHVASLDADLAGLGGDTRLVRLRLKGGYYVPVAEENVLNLRLEAGHVLGLDQDVGIAERFFIGGRTLRGFAAAGIGPRDIGTGDALGGNTYYVGTAEFSFPLGLPEDLGVRASVFAEGGSLWSLDETGADIFDSNGVRASVGAGLSWRTAVGLLRVDVAQAVLKEDSDETELLRFSIGTNF